MRRSREQTRQHILNAAYGLFWRQGFLRVSMDEIAARADITKRALYQHFRSKDDLLAAALVHSSELAIARLQGFRRAPIGTILSIRFSLSSRIWARSRDGWAGGFRGWVWEFPIFR